MATVDDVFNLCEVINSNVSSVGNNVQDVSQDVTSVGGQVQKLLDSNAAQNYNIFDPNLTVTVLGENLESGAFTNVPDAYWFSIQLTQVPQNAKTQLGMLGPNVVYAGWFGLTTGTFYLPRQPVNFEYGAFQSQSGTGGCYFTLYKGFLCTLTAYIYSGGGNGN